MKTDALVLRAFLLVHVFLFVLLSMNIKKKDLRNEYRNVNVAHLPRDLQ
jgi:hypothetical protein